MPAPYRQPEYNEITAYEAEILEMYKDQFGSQGSLKETTPVSTEPVPLILYHPDGRIYKSVEIDHKRPLIGWNALWQAVFDSLPISLKES